MSPNLLHAWKVALSQSRCQSQITVFVGSLAPNECILICQEISCRRLGAGEEVSWRRPWIHWTAQWQSMQPRKLPKLPAGGHYSAFSMQDLSMLADLMTGPEDNTGMLSLHANMTHCALCAG